MRRTLRENLVGNSQGIQECISAVWNKAYSDEEDGLFHQRGLNIFLSCFQIASASLLKSERGLIPHWADNYLLLRQPSRGRRFKACNAHKNLFDSFLHLLGCHWTGLDQTITGLGQTRLLSPCYMCALSFYFLLLLRRVSLDQIGSFYRRSRSIEV